MTDKWKGLYLKFTSRFIRSFSVCEKILWKSIKIASANIDEENNLKTVKVLINGKEYDWIFDAKNRLISEASATNDLLQTDLSGDFRSVDGILFPFSNTSQLGSLTPDLKLTSVEVNPNLTGKDWAIPQ